MGGGIGVGTRRGMAAVGVVDKVVVVVAGTARRDTAVVGVVDQVVVVVREVVLVSIDEVVDEADCRVGGSGQS